MTYTVNQTFFRPEEQKRIDWTLPASIYNLTRLALRDSKNSCVFIALRAMQFLVAIDDDEIIFVDGNGEYQIHNGEGGRIIKLAWQNFRSAERNTIDATVACEVVFYSEDAEEHFKRILGLIGPAIEEHRAVKNPLPDKGATIINLSREPQNKPD